MNYAVKSLSQETMTIKTHHKTQKSTNCSIFTKRTYLILIAAIRSFDVLAMTHHVHNVESVDTLLGQARETGAGANFYANSKCMLAVFQPFWKNWEPGQS